MNIFNQKTQKIKSKPQSISNLPAGHQNKETKKTQCGPENQIKTPIHLREGKDGAISVASPGKDGAWQFEDGDDRANGCRSLREVYKLQRGGYDGRAIVPMLWDAKEKEVVCNESYDIIELFNSGLDQVARNPGLNLTLMDLQGMIGEWNALIYPNINNGVYRVGFAQSQEAYDKAMDDLFGMLDKIEEHLATSRYLCGDRITLANVCLFTTLIRLGRRRP